MSAILRGALTFMGVNRYFHTLSLRGRVVLSQLPMSVCVGFTVIFVAVAGPEAFASRQFQAGLLLQLILLAACVLTPWHRLPYPSYWAIPLLDFVAVCLLRDGAGPAFDSVGLLAVFSVFWLTWSGVAPLSAIVISFLAPLGIIWAPLFIDPEPVSAAALAAPLLLPIIMLAVAISAHAMSESMSAQQREMQAHQLELEAKQRDLAAKEEELRRALAESRRHETLLKTVVNTVGVGLAAVDADGNRILMNRWQHRNHLIAAPDGITNPLEDDLRIFGADRVTALPREDRPLNRAVRGESFSDRLIWLGTGAGQRALSSSARPMEDAEGNFTGSVLAFNDVTDLVNALTAKDDFVASITHEFRTPLTSIIGYLELALEEDEADLPGQVAVALKVSLRNAERLLDLVSDLLSTASGSIDVHPNYACLAESIRTSLASAALSAEAAGITLVNETPATLGAMIDPQRMGQVLDNLLSNAIKYSPGGGTVTVRAWTADGAVSFQVRDTGMGLAPAEVDSLFTRFFRASAVRRAGIPGVGLGLAITKSIVEAHGGTIACTSELGVGTTFTVTLPAGGYDGGHDDGQHHAHAILAAHTDAAAARQ